MRPAPRIEVPCAPSVAPSRTSAWCSKGERFQNLVEADSVNEREMILPLRGGPTTRRRCTARTVTTRARSVSVAFRNTDLDWESFLAQWWRSPREIEDSRKTRPP